MEYLAFFDDIEKIIVEDELLKFLGVNTTGIIDFSYIDTVKSAGHSCAVVAGAYLIALKGLKALYGEALPQRGKIKVEIRNAVTQENAGVVGCVLSNITGATTDYGFGGIPTGKFGRRELLFYNCDIKEDVRLTDLETHKSVGVNYSPQKVVNPMSILLSAIKPDAKAEDIKSFPVRFQDMVKTVFDNQDRVIEVVQ